LDRVAGGEYEYEYENENEGERPRCGRRRR